MLAHCGKKAEFIEGKHSKRPYANKVASSPTFSKDGKLPCCAGPQSLICHSWALSIICQEGSHPDMSVLKARKASAPQVPPFWLLWLLPPLICWNWEGTEGSCVERGAGSPGPTSYQDQYGHAALGFPAGIWASLSVQRPHLSCGEPLGQGPCVAALLGLPLPPPSVIRTSSLSVTLHEVTPSLHY